MSHPIFRVESFEIVGPYTLRIYFDDTTVQTIDFRPILAGDLYGPLRDVSLFDQVRVVAAGVAFGLRGESLDAPIRSICPATLVIRSMLTCCNSPKLSR